SLRERFHLEHEAATHRRGPRCRLVAHLVDRAAHHLRHRLQPELTAQGKVAHRQVGGERAAALAQLSQPPLGRQRDASGFDALERLLLLSLVLHERLVPPRAGVVHAHPTSFSSAARASVLRSASSRSWAASSLTHRPASSCSRLIAMPPTLRSRPPCTRSPFTISS